MEAHTSHLVDLLRIRGDLWHLQFALLELGLVATATGRWDEARRRLDEGETINRRLGDVGNTAPFDGVIVWLDRLVGRYAQAV